MDNNTNFNSTSHEWSIISFNEPPITLVIFGACLLAALIRTLTSCLKLPHTVVLTVCGLLLGTLSLHYPEVSYYTEAIANINPQLLLHIFIPVITFSCAFKIDPHMFQKSLIQVLILAVPGFLLSACLTGVFTVWLYNHTWDWSVGMMFGAIVSTIDPATSTAELHSLGTAEHLILITEGESLFSDGTAFLMFGMFKDLAIGHGHIDVTHLAVKLVLKVLGSPLLGLVGSKIITYLLSHMFNDMTTEITLSLSVTYITFYLAQLLGMSGIIAVLIIGLLLDAVNFSPEIEELLLWCWELLTYLANTLIFFIIGLITSQAFQHMVLLDWLYILALFLAITVIRLFTVFLLSPVLSCVGHGFNWRWALVCVWGATRGAFCLCLTLMAFQAEGLDKVLVRDKILVLSCGVVILTLVINGSTTSLFFKLIGISDILPAKQKAMLRLFQAMEEATGKNIKKLKADPSMFDVNWDMVTRLVRTKNPYETSGKKQNRVDCRFTRKRRTGPDCDVNDVPRTPKQKLDEMMEIARMRILKSLTKSYWEQYSAGMLTRKATKTLINLAQTITNQKGRFMSVDDIHMYLDWEKHFSIKCWKLINWIGVIKCTKPSKNAVLKLCYKIVLSAPFNILMCIVILLNVLTIILDYIPEVSTKYDLELSVANYVFFAFYVAETVLRAMALRKAYVYDCWNYFELLILVLAAVEICAEVFARVSHIVKVLRVSKMLRLFRVLRLLKVIAQVLVKILCHEFHEQVNFGYDIATGYINALEDISKIIDHITEDQRVAEQVKSLLERDMKYAAMEIDLLQKSFPEIAISVKTRKALRSILNFNRETIQQFDSAGRVDEVEASKLEKVIEKNMKNLRDFPPAILMPIHMEVLQNVPWLRNSIPQILYLKKVSKLLNFMSGETIICENDQPEGIYLIIYGTVKVTRSRPSRGEDDQDEESEVTDYQSSGTIFGELNCLTQQPMEATVTCMTHTMTCFVTNELLHEAFDAFPDKPSLEYKMWLSLAVRSSCTILLNNSRYQDWTCHQICEYLSKGYLVDVEVNRTLALYDDSVDTVVLIHGSCDDVATQSSYQAPALISRITHQVVGRANITKLLMVPKMPSARPQDLTPVSESRVCDSVLRRGDECKGHRYLTGADSGGSDEEEPGPSGLQVW